MTRKSLCVKLWFILLAQEISSQECHLERVFRTPRDMSKVNMDHFELVERSAFNSDERSEQTSTTPPPSATAPPVNCQPQKTCANAQIMLKFGGDNLAGRNDIMFPNGLYRREISGDPYGLELSKLHSPYFPPHYCSFFPPYQPPQLCYYYPYPPPIPCNFPNYYYMPPYRHVPPKLQEYVEKNRSKKCQIKKRNNTEQCGTPDPFPEADHSENVYNRRFLKDLNNGIAEENLEENHITKETSKSVDDKAQTTESRHSIKEESSENQLKKAIEVYRKQHPEGRVRLTVSYHPVCHQNHTKLDEQLQQETLQHTVSHDESTPSTTEICDELTGSQEKTTDESRVRFAVTFPVCDQNQTESNQQHTQKNLQYSESHNESKPSSDESNSSVQQTIEDFPNDLQTHDDTLTEPIKIAARMLLISSAHPQTCNCPGGCCPRSGFSFADNAEKSRMALKSSEHPQTCTCPDCCCPRSGFLFENNDEESRMSITSLEHSQFCTGPDCCCPRPRSSLEDHEIRSRFGDHVKSVESFAINNIHPMVVRPIETHDTRTLLLVGPIQRTVDEVVAIEQDSRRSQPTFYEILPKYQAVRVYGGMAPNHEALRERLKQKSLVLAPVHVQGSPKKAEAVLFRTTAEEGGATGGFVPLRFDGVYHNSIR